MRYLSSHSTGKLATRSGESHLLDSRTKDCLLVAQFPDPWQEITGIYQKEYYKKMNDFPVINYACDDFLCPAQSKKANLPKIFNAFILVKISGVFRSLLTLHLFCILIVIFINCRIDMSLVWKVVHSTPHFTLWIALWLQLTNDVSNICTSIATLG